MAHEEKPRTLRLVATSDLRLERGFVSAGERFEAENPEAEGLFLDGRATLFGAQSCPPTSLVRALRIKMGDLSEFGPRCLNTKTISLIEDHILADGRKRSTTAGSVLKWIHGGKPMWNAVASAIEKQAPGFKDHIRQFEECWKARLNRSFETTSPTKLDHEGLRERGWAKSSRRPDKRAWDDGWVQERHYYRDVGHDWFEFREELDQVIGALAQMLLDAFKDGRALMFQSEHGLWTLTPPWDWQEAEKLARVPSQAHYLLSRDLPSQWFPSRAQLRGPERERAVDEVRRDIEQRYLAQAPDHHLIRKESVIELLAEIYGYPDSIIRSAWKNAQIPAWKGKGSRKRAGSLSLSRTNQKS